LPEVSLVSVVVVGVGFGVNAARLTSIGVTAVLPLRAAMSVAAAAAAVEIPPITTARREITRCSPL
jgi:hypothetical protein